MSLKLPIGISDFKEVIEEGYYFIDKTQFIEEIVENSSKVLLFTRPRRFGKTLNLSMLRYFLSSYPAEINPDLFKGTLLAENDIFCRKHQNQYPVIFVTFKNIKALSFDSAYASIYHLIRELYRTLKTQLYDSLSDEYQQIYLSIMNRTIVDKEEEISTLKNSLAYLSQFFHSVTGQQSYLLVDEYDTPITASYLNHYYDEMVDLMRGLLGSACKYNEFLKKGVITGITRVSQESIFSGFNNPEVYSMLRPDLGRHFGFIEDEVIKLLQTDGHLEQFDEIKRWYNGYQVGDHILYNPWSILNCVRRNYHFQPYWLHTSDNALIKSIIVSGKRTIKEKMIDLLQGDTIERPLRENLIFPNLKKNEEAFWSLMHASGYLSTDSSTHMDYDANAKLSIPNKEVMYVYTDMVEHWFSDSIDLDTYREFIDSLASGNIEKFCNILQAYLIQSGSYFDFNKNAPEQVFHTFMLGLVVGLRDEYVISSNLESGFGRYDLGLFPKKADGQGILLEFKLSDSLEDLPKMAQAALDQIKDKKYITKFTEYGVSVVQAIGLAFHSKQVKIASEIISTD